MNRRHFFSSLGLAPLAAMLSTGRQTGRNAVVNTPSDNGHLQDSQCIELGETEVGVIRCGDYVESIVADIGQRGQKRIVGLRTYFRELDEMIGGMRKGDLVVVAGRPSMGKAALALSIAGRVAMGGSAPPRAADAKPVLMLYLWPAAGEFLRTGSAGLPIATDRRFLLGLKCNNRPCHSIHANPILMLWVIISPLTTVTLVNRRLGLRRFRLR